MKKLGFSFILSLVAMTLLCLTACDVRQKMIEKQVAALNASTPMMIDPTIRLDKVEALPGLAIKFTSTMIGSDKEAFDTLESETNLVARMKKEMVASLKTNQGFTDVKRAGVTFVYSFQDDAGEHLFDITISPEDYLSGKL